MIHFFDTDIASAYGIIEAILLHNIYYWCEKNRANGIHEHDGLFWTYNSIRAFAALFPYISEKQIRNAIAHLVEEGLIETGHYNENPHDRTLWYAVTEKGEQTVKMSACILPKGQMTFSEKGKCIVNNILLSNYTDNKPNNKQNNKTERLIEARARKEKKRFCPPSVEEVRAYCEERGNSIDPETFIDFYAMKGWRVGKEPMKDWKAAVRTWERRKTQTKAERQKPKEKPSYDIDDFAAAAIERSYGPDFFKGGK